MRVIVAVGRRKGSRGTGQREPWVWNYRWTSSVYPSGPSRRFMPPKILLDVQNEMAKHGTFVDPQGTIVRQSPYRRRPL